MATMALNLDRNLTSVFYPHPLIVNPPLESATAPDPLSNLLRNHVGVAAIIIFTPSTPNQSGAQH